MKHLLKMSDLTPAELTHILDVADDLKAADVLAACREAGLLVLTAKTRLRLLPPLTLSEHDVDMALDILRDVLTKMEPTAPKEQA